MASSRYGRMKLSAEKQALLQRLLQQQGLTAQTEQKSIQREQTVPLSFAQQRVWFLHQIEPTSSNFHMLTGLRLLGDLHVDALEASLNEIIRRHDILRTTFPVVHGLPVQHIGPAYTLKLELVVLVNLSEQEQKQEIIRTIRKDKQKPFHLESGPLLRVYLFATRENEHILFLSLHHIIADAWSMGILSQELSQLYDAFVNERPSPLPPLAVQYADFVQWQQERVQGERGNAQLHYWLQRLSDSPAPLALPTDHPRHARQGYSGHTFSFTLDAALHEKLIALCQREGVTLVMLMLAAFQVLLSRYTGQEDIAVGLPVSNRTRTDFEPLIGNFVNTVVIRADLKENPTFRTILQRVKADALDAYSNQDIPFERVVEALRPVRDPGRTVLFQILFSLQNAYREQELTGLVCLPFEVEDNAFYGE
ncbi:condensation domain-containing protein [Thermosporothrix hazakensis]|uniref:Condensation domain-containing protein n=1 Tax=Thermosporothrix hazakensis TaxID=644383 RepID=A0A326UDA6_THEHA|nr:condensation domain-containing protein [Thermosporothrix hazakensis]PZW27161.1 condensation domain-containing protein [Thermosporothrix hazakensis]GCE50445.1 hypothetical protein KTH_53140 [Thermosporothrix hazakensis]